jgi:tetratricopeptide (TPR) repeat protein
MYRVEVTIKKLKESLGSQEKMKQTAVKRSEVKYLQMKKSYFLKYFPSAGRSLTVRPVVAHSQQQKLTSIALVLAACLVVMCPIAQTHAQSSIQLPSITATPPNPKNLTGSLPSDPNNASVPKSITTITQQAARLLKEGKPEMALEGIDKGLESSPRDAQLQFLRGVALADLKKVDAAIVIFTTLTQEFPELPEPYNNLAVLYANEGDLDKAKASLEAAIKALPNYALAHENLGDLYLQLAARQFDRAAKANPKSPFAARKLVLAKDWVNLLGKLNVQ